MITDHVDDYVAQLEAIQDPLGRFRRAASEQDVHETVSRRLTCIRALALLELHEQGNHSYAKLAALTGLSRARCQQFVEMGRRLRG